MHIDKAIREVPPPDALVSPATATPICVPAGWRRVSTSRAVSSFFCVSSAVSCASSPLGSHLQGNKRMRAESFHNCEAGGAGTTTEILSNGGRERRWEERWNLFVGCQGYIRILQRIGTDGVHATMCTQCSRSGGRRLQDGICPETRVKTPPVATGV
jgi:hypothetical protein